LPAIYRPDENVAVGRAMGVLHGVLDPHFADWPHLFFYLSAAWLLPAHLVGLVTDQASAHLWVRALSALLGTATVLLVIDFGRRAYGWNAGLLGGAGLAVAFLAVRDSHFGTPDTALALVITGALYVAYRTVDRVGMRPLLLNGIALGIAASFKYNGALVFLAAATGQAWRAFRVPTPARTVIRRLVMVALIGLVTLVVTSPFLLLDPSMTAHGLGYIVSHLASETVDQVGWIRLLVALWYGLDPGLFILALAGVGYALWRRTVADWILLAFVLPYYVLIGAGHSVFFRYADPLIPPLCLLGGRTAADLVGRVTIRPWRAPAVAAILAIVTLPAGFHDLRFDTLIQQTDTRTLAYTWLQDHVASGSMVAIPYKPGPAHDQALVDGRTQSLGATDPYVASFLENRLETRYRVRDLSEDDLQQQTVAALRAEGVAYVVIGRKRPDLGCAGSTPLEQELQAQARLVARFDPVRSGCPTGSVFDSIDTNYVPLAGYAGYLRPGPVLRIYALGD
jgi:predicted membrane-bound dolichyl-phosphate-mannose-protein mannosyltransferase